MQPAIQQFVQDLADHLDRAVSICDAAFVPVAFSAQPPDVDRVRMLSLLQRKAGDDVIALVRRRGLAQARGPVRTPAAPDIGMKARICTPLRAGRTLLGYLWVIDADETVPDAEFGRIADAAAAAAALLAEEQQAQFASAARTGGLMLRMVTGTTDHRRSALEDLRDDDGFAAERCAVVVVRDDARGNLPSHVVLPLGSHFAMTPLVRLDSSLIGFVAADDADDERVREAARWTLDACCRELGCDHTPVSLRAGVGRRLPTLACDRSYLEAVDALTASAAFPALGRVVEWRALGSLAVLTEAARTGAGSELEVLVEPLTTADRHGDLLRTAIEYFDHGGDAQATATALGLHRTSLYYRLNRIEGILGVSLRDGEARLAVHMALKLTRLRAVSAARPTSLRFDASTALSA